jgi:hypothetical protein
MRPKAASMEATVPLIESPGGEARSVMRTGRPMNADDMAR